MSRIWQLAARLPTLVLARRNISRATARSVLAVVAVVIGVVAIGGIGVGGEALKQDQLEAYQGFGGTATVSPVYHPGARTEGDRSFSDAEIARMRQATTGGTILPVIEADDSTVRTPTGEVILLARVKSLPDPDSFYDAETGTIPDNWRRSAVVGSRVASNNDLQVGEYITVDVNGSFRKQFRVAAVLQAQGFAGPLSADQTVFLPPAQFETETYDEALVTVNPQVGSVDGAKQELEDEFNTRRRTVHVSPVQEQREQFAESFATINKFLIGVGAISLLVAAVTIANTMVMATIEREGEIGVLRAVGYPKRAVVTLLLTEATILGVIGAVVGAPLALGIGMVANEILLGDPLSFTTTGLQYVALGVAAGIGTSLLAGVYPAWKAANRRPVEVLD